MAVLQNGLGLGHGRLEGGGTAPQLLPAPALGQLGGVISSAGQQQGLGVPPHGGGLEQGLCVVIIVFQLEYLHQPPVGHRRLHVPEHVGPGGGQGLIQTAPLGVAALGQHLPCLAVVGGIDHPVHPVPGQQAVFHGPDPGGDREIIRIFSVGQGIPPPLLKSLLRHYSGNKTWATCFSSFSRWRRTSVSKVQLISTSLSSMTKPPRIFRVS